MCACIEGKFIHSCWDQQGNKVHSKTFGTKNTPLGLVPDILRHWLVKGIVIVTDVGSPPVVVANTVVVGLAIWTMLKRAESHRRASISITNVVIFHVGCHRILPP